MKWLAATAAMAALSIVPPAAARDAPAAIFRVALAAAASPADALGVLRSAARPLHYASTFKRSAWRRVATGSDPCAASVALVRSAIGRSSGFLVGRQRRIVLSTAHGLVDEASGQPQRRATVRFDDSPDGPVAFGATVIRLGATGDFATGKAAHDWAILLLDRPARHVESLALRYDGMADLRRYGPGLSLIAYHYDFMSGDRAAISEGCSITDGADGLALHDCDAMVGSSGGPILHREAGRCVALAINQGCLGRHRRDLDYASHGADANANRAVPLGNLRDALEPILHSVEAGAGARDLLGPGSEDR